MGWRGALAGGLMLAAGCGSSSDGGSGAEQAALPSKLAVTADWLHHTASLVDFDALVAHPASGEAVRLATIDLSKYPQGPYTVKITPDGKTAILALSPGFFTVPGAPSLVGATSIPTGPSKVVFVDLASKKVVNELDTGDGPTGIAITHDGRLAFVAHAGGNDLAVVDLQTHAVVKKIDLGGNYAEDVSLDDTDTVGIVTSLDPATTQKVARTFSVADMAATISDPIPLNNDAASVPFFPGKKVAFVVLAYNPLTSPQAGYALIDATDPHAPTKLVQTMWSDATYVVFDAIPAPARGTVLVPLATGSKLSVREYELAGSDATLKKTWDVGTTKTFGAFGAALDGTDHLVVTMPADRELGVLNLASGSAFTVPWFNAPGPMGIALR